VRMFEISDRFHSCSVLQEKLLANLDENNKLEESAGSDDEVSTNYIIIQ